MTELRTLALPWFSTKLHVQSAIQRNPLQRAFCKEGLNVFPPSTESHWLQRASSQGMEKSHCGDGARAERAATAAPHQSPIGQPLYYSSLHRALWISIDFRKDKYWYYAGGLQLLEVGRELNISHNFGQISHEGVIFRSYFSMHVQLVHFCDSSAANL